MSEGDYTKKMAGMTAVIVSNLYYLVNLLQINPQ